MNRDIVVISYFGATGGNFVQAYLNDAKNNKHIPISYSTYGNAHQYKNDLPVGMFHMKTPSDEEKVKTILSTDPIINTVPPYFVRAHIADINYLSTVFEKNIRITYDINEMDTLFYIGIGKIFNDMNLYTSDEGNFYKKINIPYLQNLMNEKRQLHNKGIEFYSNFFINDGHSTVLYLPFNELLNACEVQVTKKLSDYTNVPYDNFNIDNLRKWRELTNFCINDIRYIADFS